ncbi:MAG: NADH:flavin oxidoreductase [Syntrophales bacterium]
MSILFEPITIKNLQIRNHFVRSATYDGCADAEGFVTQNQIDFYSRLSAGGVGLIVTGITCVLESGKLMRFQNSLTDDRFIDGMRRLTGAVHSEGGKIAAQLCHAGREARHLPAHDSLPVAPSLVKGDPYFSGKCRAIETAEIWEIISAFGDAAKRAREADFDAVQIHGAHAYLLSQFLSPFTNRRSDEWGGSLSNRLRIHKEIYMNIRKKVGEDYPIMIKIGVVDCVQDGLSPPEGQAAAQCLGEIGYDALEISQGLRGQGYEQSEFRPNVVTIAQEAYFREYSRGVKAKIKVPVILVGGLRSLDLMEEIVALGDADFVSLSRPLIKEPNLIREWEGGPAAARNAFRATGV